MDLVTRQREERRQRILDVARLLIADRGYEGVTMRELAEKSLVSVPTLYNLFGGKNELLFAAVESYFERLLWGGRRAGTEEGLSKLLSLIETVSRETVRHAAYMRALMGFFGGPGASAGLLELVSSELTSQIMEALEQMQSQRQLAAWVNPRALSERLTGQLTIVTFEWSQRLLSDAGLRGAMLYGTGALLLGLARGKAAGEIERLVRKHQSAAVARKGGRADPRRTETLDGS
jgi:AcrR family transcriptional regulator